MEIRGNGLFPYRWGSHAITLSAHPRILRKELALAKKGRRVEQGERGAIKGQVSEQRLAKRKIGDEEALYVWRAISAPPK